MTDLTKLPDNLPAPKNDGACDHLLGKTVPSIALLATDGSRVDLSSFTDRRVVVYAYPMTASPGVHIPEGWDMIPGARGCTSQACDFRDHYQQIKQHGAETFGLSIQGHDPQKETSARLHLPFLLLSDADMRLTKELELPTFTVEDYTLLKRHTLIIRAGVIEHLFYPVFPPNRHAKDIISWLENNPL